MNQARSVDPAAVARSVAELRAEDLGKGELRAALNVVVEASATVFGADGAGVMLIDDQQALHYVGATDGRAAALEAAQEETGEGPCVDSLVNNTLVCTPDLVADDRWPHLTQQIGSLGVRALLGAPLRLGMGAIGSLNVYRFEPWIWEDDDIAGVEAFAQVVEELLGSSILARQRHRIVDQLSQALDAPGGDRAGGGGVDGHRGRRRRPRLRRAAPSGAGPPGPCQRAGRGAPLGPSFQHRDGWKHRNRRIGSTMSPAIVSLCGDIDLASLEATERALADAVACARAKGVDVVVDLSEVSFLDSTGMSCLVAASRALGPDHSLYLRAPHRMPRRVLEIAGLEYMISD